MEEVADAVHGLDHRPIGLWPGRLKIAENKVVFKQIFKHAEYDRRWSNGTARKNRTSSVERLANSTAHLPIIAPSFALFQTTASSSASRSSKFVDMSVVQKK